MYGLNVCPINESGNSVGAYSPSSPKAQRKVLQDIHIIIVHCTKITLCPTLHIFPKVFSKAYIVSTVRGLNPGGGEILLTCPDGPWGPPSLLYNGYRVFPRVKSGRSLTLNPHPLLVPWSWKGRAIFYSPCGPYGLYRASVPVQGCTLHSFRSGSKRQHCRSCVISLRVHHVIYDCRKLEYTRTAIGCSAVK